MAKPRPLAGKAALVTGGTSGIGRAVAAVLLAEGCRTAVLARNPSAADGDVALEGALRIACDIRDEADVRSAVARAADELGTIDILVNAAGVSMPEFRDLEAIDMELWRRLLETNLTGMYLICREALPIMKRRGSGDIIAILSTAAFRSIARNAPYSASKYGARAVIETVAEEVKGTRIRVSSISPGPVDTNIWTHKTQEVSAERRRKMLRADDIADIALFLLTRPEYVRIGGITVVPDFPED